MRQPHQEEEKYQPKKETTKAMPVAAATTIAKPAEAIHVSGWFTQDVFDNAKCATVAPAKKRQNRVRNHRQAQKQAQPAPKVQQKPVEAKWRPFDQEKDSKNWGDIDLGSIFMQKKSLQI